MLNKAFLRGLLGFPLGVFLGYVITIFISVIIANGQYSPCAPALIDQVGSEIGAVILQAILSGILGAGYAAASVIWECEDWNIAKQSGIYFAITSLIMLPVAYYANWMEHTLIGFLIYFGIFIAIFLIVWVIQYFFWKNKIKRLNEKINS